MYIVNISNSVLRGIFIIFVLMPIHILFIFYRLYCTEFYFPTINFFKLFYYFSSTVFIFTPPCSPPHPSLPRTLKLIPFGVVPVSFVHVPQWSNPYFPTLSLSPLLSGYRQFVLNFNVSGYNLLACLLFD